MLKNSSNAARFTRFDPMEITEADWDFQHDINLTADWQYHDTPRGTRVEACWKDTQLVQCQRCCVLQSIVAQLQ